MKTKIFTFTFVPDICVKNQQNFQIYLLKPEPEVPIVSSSSSMLEEPVWVSEDQKEYNTNRGSLNITLIDAD